MSYSWPGMDDFESGSGDPSRKDDGTTPPPADKSDGHTYDLQKTQNVSGLDWQTVDSFNNLEDALNAYDSKVGTGGLWQLLRDGDIYDTNLPVDQRYDATQKKKEEDYVKHEYSCEYLMKDGTWSWFATAATLDEAIAKVKSAQEGTAYATISYGKYQIRDWNGDVVWSQTIDTPTPDDTTPSTSTTGTSFGDMKGLILIVAAVGIGLFLLYMLKGAKHAKN